MSLTGIFHRYTYIFHGYSGISVVFRYFGDSCDPEKISIFDWQKCFTKRRVNYHKISSGDKNKKQCWKQRIGLNSFYTKILQTLPQYTMEESNFNFIGMSDYMYIWNREDLRYTCITIAGDINLKVLVGQIEGTSKEGQNELVISALMNTKRFC